MSKKLGFTLTELLIALAVLGIIAAFTIPKLLDAQSNAQNLSVAKEIVMEMKNLHDLYLAEKGTNPTPLAFRDYLYQKMNLVKRNSGSLVGTGAPLYYGAPHLVLHNGAYMTWIGDEGSAGGGVNLDFDVNGKALPNAYCPNTGSAKPTDDGTKVLYKDSLCNQSPGDILVFTIRPDGTITPGSEAKSIEFSLIDHF